jgi:uncharacterized protein (DUF1800 family)
MYWQNEAAHMVLNRRAFNVSSLALLMASAMRMPAHAASVATTMLNRLTFGQNQKSTDEFSKLGLEKWLDAQLAMPASNADLEKRLSAARLMIEYGADKGDNNSSWPARKEMIPYQYLQTTGEQLLPLLDFQNHPMSYEERIRPAREVQAASLIRAVHAEAQLREVMTQFWHDHFNVNSMRDEHTGAYFALYDKMLRENAFGNFRKMLGEVTRSPAMLYYLNNEASKASPANENFARELFELHTLGAGNYFNDRTTEWHKVPGAAQGLAEGYIDQDVYEAARALTGWSFGDGRYISEGDNAPETGAFHYIDRWHDPYQKRILAVEFKANSGPMEDGEKLLDILAQHSGTATFLCTKICRRLLADDPPQSLIEKAKATWLDNVSADDQIGKTIRTIVLSPEFENVAPSKLKRPFEFLASLYRAANAEVSSPSLSFVWSLSKAGWNQHEFRPPTGHPDDAGHWANTNLISGFVDLSLNALEDWAEAGKANLSANLPSTAITIGDAAQHCFALLHGNAPDVENMDELVKLMTGDATASLPQDINEREHVLRGLVAAAALTPQFLYR